jgi:nicotinate-nucleotide--dimethylbenzimidazole phosphoribosyltransferase
VQDPDKDWIREPLARPDVQYFERAQQRQSSLTKPLGSLGELESVAIRLCALQSRDRPVVDRPVVVIFAADHGVAERRRVRLPAGGNRRDGAQLRARRRGDFRTGAQPRRAPRGGEPWNGHRTRILGRCRRCPNRPGTANFVNHEAMTVQQFAIALGAGRDAVERARAIGADLFIGGDMGIANTTSATAIACALLDEAPQALAGPGTGLDAAGIRHKALVIDRALACHADSTGDPERVLQCLGGFEIAALTGAYIRCGQQALPVLVDGFISSVAALVALRIQPSLGEWLFLAHRSAEPGHDRVIEALALNPLLDLRMRLGEGSGAAVAVPLLRLACDLHRGMATFDEARVSGRIDA